MPCVLGAAVHISQLRSQGIRILTLIPPVGPLVMMLVMMLSDVLRWVAISAAAIMAFGAGLYRLLNAGLELQDECDEYEACCEPSAFASLCPNTIAALRPRWICR